MELQRIEARNYRSIRSLWGDNALEFEDLNCLVGKNNVGKSNIISAIKYLFEEEDKPKDEELYWNKDTSKTVEVRGFFKVSDQDLDRLEDEGGREDIRNLLLEEGMVHNHLGICRITGPNGDNGSGRTRLKLLQFRPTDERLSENKFDNYHLEQWEKTNTDEGFTVTDYRDAMEQEYPEVADFVEDGKLTQKRAWKEGYLRYIESSPDDVELELEPTEFPTGTKSRIRDFILPDVVKIPAVKEVEDATQASGELGELTDALYGEIQEDIDEKLDTQLEGVYERLDTDSRSFESQISSYLKEAFRDYSVELDFPRVESRQFFQGVNVRIEDDQLEDTLSHENVGEGVRRVLIFSMLRTIADLRDGSLTADSGTKEGAEGKQPLLILYEEAELFLHPNLQKTLLRVFRNLCDGEVQIVFNTHSPLLLQNQIIDTINIVRNEKGTVVTQFHTVLDNREPREQSRLMDLQKVSSYIFSDRVVLVEGMSDAIILKKLSSAIDPDWKFESQGIPVLPVGGKNNLPLFKNFLEELGIDVFIMADIGALRSTAHSLVADGFPHDKIEDLKSKAGTLVEDGEVDQSWTSSDIENEILTATWERTFERFKELKKRLENGEEVDREHIESIKKLLNKKSEAAWREAISSDHERINSDRLDLRSRLLDEDFLLLNGEIEDYYPEIDVSNKTEAALEFSTDNYNLEELRGHFVEISDDGDTDLEFFLSKVFQASS